MSPELIGIGLAFAAASLTAALLVVVYLRHLIMKRVHKLRFEHNRMKPVARRGRSVDLDEDRLYQAGDHQRWKRTPRHERLPPKRR